jgi:hypothetical protein
MAKEWRRGWDSNPRMGFTPINGLANPRAETTNPFERPQIPDGMGAQTPREQRFSREDLGLARAQDPAQRKTKPVKPIEDLLSRFVVTPSGCHEWTGSTNGKGYGVLLLGIDGRKVLFLAHRLQWMHHHGHIPPAGIIMHKCDNRRCLRIEHLALGTQYDNMHDMMRKGRQDHSGLLNYRGPAHYPAQSRKKDSDHG